MRPPRERPTEPDDQVDLHGMTPTAALRRLAQELHACRMRRRRELLVITGRGYGNAAQIPVLRGQVETWLRGADGQRLGVESFALHSRGGALLVRLRGAAALDEDRDHEGPYDGDRDDA